MRPAAKRGNRRMQAPRIAAALQARLALRFVIAAAAAAKLAEGCGRVQNEGAVGW